MASLSFRRIERSGVNHRFLASCCEMVLPPAAIRTFAGRKFVEIEEDGVRKRVDVVLGIESAERVEIREGLEEGQTVVGQ